MKKIAVLLIAFVAISVLSLGCSNALPPQGRDDKVEVDAVYMHGVNCYSFMVCHPDGRIEHYKPMRFSGCEVQLFRDVPKGEKSWYSGGYRNFRRPPRKCYLNLELHLHSIEDIQTSGWNHGKFGSGTINRVD